MTQTGLIWLSTKPSGADVFLKKSRYIYKTPVGIKELYPGNYKIMLKLKGYTPWTHDALIAPGKAVAFEKILLIPKKWRMEYLSDDSYSELIPAPSVDGIILAKSGQLGNFYIFTPDNKEMRPISEPESAYGELPVNSILLQDDSPSAVLSCGYFWDRRYLFIEDLKAAKPVIKDISAFFRERPSHIIWDVHAYNKFFAVYKDAVDRIDAESRVVSRGYLKNIKGFGLRHGSVYFINAGSNLFKKYGQKNEPVFSNRYFDKQFFNGSDFYRVKVLRDNMFLFISDNGRLMASQPPYHLECSGVLGVDFSERGDSLLYWTKDSANIFDFSRSPQKIYGSGKNIRQCFWVYQDSHLLCNDNDSVYLIEPQPQGSSHVDFVTGVKKNSSVYYSDETGFVYYLDEQSAKLKAIEVAPNGI